MWHSAGCRTGGLRLSGTCCPEMEWLLSLPQTRILEIVKDLAARTGDALSGAGSAVLRVFNRKADGASSKPVKVSGPPALVPSGRRVYAIGDVHGRADLLQRLLQDLREDARYGE